MSLVALTVGLVATVLGCDVTVDDVGEMPREFTAVTEKWYYLFGSSPVKVCDVPVDLN